MSLNNQNTMVMRVAAYVRVSSGKDAMLHSLSAQVSYYSDLIQRHQGWEYVGVYADEALTGTKDTRENFQRLLSDCRNEKIDIVITKSISRFARNTVTLLESVSVCCRSLHHALKELLRQFSFCLWWSPLLQLFAHRLV